MVNWLVYLNIYTFASAGVILLTLFVLAIALAISRRQEEKRITILTSISVVFRMILNLGFQLEFKKYHTIKIVIFVECNETLVAVFPVVCLKE